LLIARPRQAELPRDEADAPVELRNRDGPVVEERQRSDEPAVDTRRGDGHGSSMPVRASRVCADFVPVLRK
jgi:hypothetical protein